MSPINHSDRWLSIVGIGEDGMAGLSPLAAAVVGRAELLVGGARHLAMVPEGAAERLVWPSPLTEAIDPIKAARGRRVVVLASGDPFLWGVGATLARFIPPAEMACHPAPSSFSLAAARLGWAQQDCALISLHGRPFETLVAHIQPDARILALTWDGRTAAKAAARLTELGFGPSRLTVLERLGGSGERIRSARADAFDLDGIDPLNVLAIEVVAGHGARPLPLAGGLPDEFFEHDGQLTKREIRAVTLSALAPLRGQLLWDIGLGAGSVAIEWLLRHPSNRAIGIEENADRATRALVNAVNLGVPHLRLVSGAAPAALAGLEPPDAVFIGGGTGDDGVFEAAWTALRPGGRLVANAVTLESEQALARRFAQYGGDLIRLSVERLVPVGSMHGWRPAMPVTQWSVVKPGNPGP
ncbi:precorrin-6y C5,15-methyltransferase (decarboxylating) subunit CbiE [Labrys sp. LIt4]|uniref:precorrin-6y C5,15-methyltransferase (decarboxylating) subunit CbiE n=1 Tax=Labrys sp. LIt4 TaxID=2821355 RepID=UPI001ADEFD25|nr:precorrin-6y C5,15-methyltransferase (decarboxylating) subunit CbiE [Labrys sp. LIt4]MBP0577773.1 precorrin-6y C5,15-methyltransferase (decarboxylating) subunit CbiE [Labrys sp. LIt4]